MPRRLALPLSVTAALVVGAAAVPAADAATFTVTSTADSGAGTLRRAINDANAAAGADRLAFAIAGAGVHTITPLTPLPVIAGKTDLDGLSQAGSAAPTAGAPAVLRIAIDGSNLQRAIDLGASDSRIRGLAVHSAQSDGIVIEGSRNVVSANHVGLDAGGSVPLGSWTSGIKVIGGGNNRIGGPAPAARNAIGANRTGIWLEGGNASVVEGNRIGTTADGLTGTNTAYGVGVEEDKAVIRDNLISGNYVGVEVYGDYALVDDNTIGTDLTGSVAVAGSGLGVNIEGGDDATVEDNLVSGNVFGGIQVESGVDEALRAVVQRNLVGLDAAGTAAIPNGAGFAQPGIAMYSPDALVQDNEVAWSDGPGIVVLDDRVALLRNALHDNDELGIDLDWDGLTPNDPGDADVGANLLQNTPVLAIPTGSKVPWTLDSTPSTKYLLEVFASTSCDPSGSGEATEYLASTTVATAANGQGAGTLKLLTAPAPGTVLTATVTELDAAGKPQRTSELSSCQVAP